MTVKGRQMAEKRGQSLQRLGLANANIYHSPLRRTEQTSSDAFNRTTQGQDWLIHCRKSMLGDVVAHKQPGHNLVLVTHSECINALEKQAGIRGGSGPGYAIALFVTVDPITGASHVLGAVNPSQWSRMLHHRKG